MFSTRRTGGREEGLFLDFGHPMTKELVRRTIMNLQFIEAGVEAGRMSGEIPVVFEITQLINSTLGAIIAPYESEQFADTDQYWHTLLAAVTLNERAERRLKQIGSLARLARFLRNAFAHGNFQFVVHDENVTGIVLWSDQVRPVQLGTDEFRCLTLSLAALILSDGATATLVPAMIRRNPST